VPKKPLPMPNFGDGCSPDQLRTTAEMMYNIDSKTCINIAFLGRNNKAKIDLINACRYIADCKPDSGIDSPNKAAVQYHHCDPAYRHVRFWDISDCSGTFEHKCLYIFDAVVMVVTEFLGRGEMELIKQASNTEPATCILVVRSEMDHFVDKEFGFNPTLDLVTKEKNQEGRVIREGLTHQLVKGNIDGQRQGASVFLMSAPGMLAARGVNSNGAKYIWDEYDFTKRLLDTVSKKRY